MTELARSAAAQQVQHHAAATAFAAIEHLVDLSLVRPRRLCEQQPMFQAQHSTACTANVCSCNHSTQTAAFAGVDNNRQDSQQEAGVKHEGRKKTLKHIHHTRRSGMEQHCLQPAPAETLTSQNNRPKPATKKRSRHPCAAQPIAPETPEQGDATQRRAVFRRTDTRETGVIQAGRARLGDIVWAKVQNHPAWPAQVSLPADLKPLMHCMIYGGQHAKPVCAYQSDTMQTFGLGVYSYELSMLV